MADVVLSRREIQLIMENGQIDAKYSNYTNAAFIPVPLSIDVIEKGKKTETKIPSTLKQLIYNKPDSVNMIPLSPIGLYKAMNDDSFSRKYINRCGNPFELATEACVYEYEEWWDQAELKDSISELPWT